MEIDFGGQFDIIDLNKQLRYRLYNIYATIIY